mmetsp:Transcript_17199/g.17935  ORF Transcript_17199/g.17935 Transcript_17199/m.17935 type:complete len:262 (+) Transcript_17199:26-811(+)
MARIFLLRHGQSYHNHHIHNILKTHNISHLPWWEIEDIHDPKIRDTDLTPTGIEQARALNQAISELNPSLIIASPLTRSIRTAHEACGHCGAPFHITPLLREQSFSICDVGTPPSKLIEQWPQYASQLSDLTSDWWCNTEEQKQYVNDTYLDLPSEAYRESWQHLQDRIEDLVAYVEEQIRQGHHTIVLVGHAVLFYGITGRWVNNCQLIELKLDEIRQRCECSGIVCKCEGENVSYLTPAIVSEEKEKAHQKETEVKQEN